MTVRLSKAEAFRFQGMATYWVLYDYAAGSKNRYTVLLNSTNAPIVVGRELPLKLCRQVIAELEKVIKDKEGIYYGDTVTAQRVVKAWIESKRGAGE